MFKFKDTNFNKTEIFSKVSKYLNYTKAQNLSTNSNPYYRNKSFDKENIQSNNKQNKSRFQSLQNTTGVTTGVPTSYLKSKSELDKEIGDRLISLRYEFKNTQNY